MTGALELDDAGRLYLNNTKLDTRVRKESLKDGNGDPVLDGNGNEQWDDNEERFTKFESLPPHLLKSDGTFSADTSEPFGIDIEIDDGNTFKNQLKVSNRNGSIVSIASGTGPVVNLGKNFPGNQNPNNGDAHWVSGEAGGVKVTGIPTPTKENPDSSLAANKGYVDQREAFLQSEIIELEEEINAIAPTVERGTWAYNANAIVPNTAPGDGNFYLQEDGATIVTDYPSSNRVFLSKKNSVGDDVTFANVVVDQLIGLFDADDNDYLIGTITAVDASNSAYVQIDFTFEQGEGAPEDTKLARLNIFEAPTGGSGSEFLPLAGGTMTGEVKFDGDVSYNGILVNGLAGKTYNNSQRKVFQVGSGSGFTAPYVTIGVEPTLDTHAVTKKYVDDGFVLKTGDTMTGDLTIEYPNKIKVKNLVSLPDESLVIAYGDTWRISVNEDKVNFNKPAHCSAAVTEDTQYANKKYVDDKFDFSQYTELS